MSNIALAVKMSVDDFFLDEITKELKKLQKATHEKDEGCIQYDLHKIIDDKNSFMLIEKWKDAESLEQHKQKEHFLNFVKNTKSKILSLESNILNKM